MPQIRFFRDRAGRRIAYAVDGSGPALVCPAWWVSHVEEDFQHASFRRFFGALASEHLVVRYDRPGVGLSDRAPANVDLAGEVQVMTELISELGLTEVALLGLSCGGPIALAYAAEGATKVTRMIFWGSYLRGAEIAQPAVKEAMIGLVRAHWGLASRALADVFLPGMGNDELTEFARRQRSAANAETAAHLLELTYAFDASDAAPRVRAPALVAHRRGDRAIGFEAGRELAATLPGATFLPLEGRAHPPWEGDDSGLAAIAAFLRGEVPGAPRREEAVGLDVDRRALVIGGERQELTRLEFGVIEYLVARPDRVVTRDDLLRDVWNQPFAGSNVVDAVIRSLRKKLADHASCIETVTGHGYRFVGFRR